MDLDLPLFAYNPPDPVPEIAASQSGRVTTTPRADPMCCSRCFRWHVGGLCNHDSEAICTGCGLQVGYKGDDAQPSALCCWCWSGLARPVAALIPAEILIAAREDAEWLEGL